MLLILTKEEHYVCIEIEGRLDTLTAADFDVEVSKIMEKEHLLLFDFSKCRYLSSNGIRSLMIISKKLASRKQGKLILVSVPAEIRHVLEVSGLDRVFTIADSLKDGVGILEKDFEAPLKLLKTGDENWLFECQSSSMLGQTGWLWHKEGIAGQDELGVAVGDGRPAEAFETGAHGDGLLFTAGSLAAFIPDDQSAVSDFRISVEPSQAGIIVNEACSFGLEANAFLRLTGDAPITWKELLEAINELSGKINKNRLITGFVIASDHPGWKGVTTGIVAETDLVSQTDRQSLYFLKSSDEMSPILSFAAMTLTLEKMQQPSAGGSLSSFLNGHISFENVVGLKSMALDENFVNPVVWLFIGDKTMDAGSKRISITAPDVFYDGPYKSFLVRRLYKDSSRLELKALQGGFSAQTFHVTSWDAAGRKLRPTVLKIADRDMITREAKHCKEYAMPYILNNSAMILGTEFFGASGALRYNFVGIGGEENKLKWLTNYFLEWQPEQLEPLFDKIFLKILKPWYGQAVKQTIYPYRDHDPTKTFFPDIFPKAEALLAVSADDKQVMVKEMGRNMINPYWVLKYHYLKMEDMEVESCTSICHGDLNMQNILLDEQMNVYLIDFSETRPRSVVSDFARMEAIFMTEFMPVKTDGDLKQMVDVLLDFYGDTDFEARNNWAGNINEAIRRNLYMSTLMRRYAIHHAGGCTFVQPYFLAMLEWVLPVVCYRQATPLQKRLSFILASILFEKLGLRE